MQRRRHGFATTLLMLVPMLGVPAMAIFGIPQFAPLFSSMTSHADEPELPGFHEPRVGLSATGSPRSVELPAVEPLDLFQPYGQSSAVSTDSDSGPAQMPINWSDPLKATRSSLSPSASAHRSAAHRETSVRSSRQMHQQVYDIFANDFGAQPTENSLPASSYSSQPNKSRAEPVGLPAQPSLGLDNQTFTWRHAAERLNEYGATSYRLTPGARANDYRFVCIVESTDDQRISRRFEAESSDPLVAVENVLNQIAAWRRRLAE